MSSSAERLLAALRSHPRRVMTSTELTAKVADIAPDEVADTVRRLRAERAVVVHDLALTDPHFPAMSTIALIDRTTDGDDAEAAAHRRAAECARVVERQLLRSHRCQ